MKSGEVGADLMRAAGVKLDFEKREAADAGENTPVGAGFAGSADDGPPGLRRGRQFHARPQSGRRSHADAAARIARNSQIDAAMIFGEFPFDEGQVSLPDFAAAKSFGETGVCGIILGNEDGARGFFVQAMDDSRAKGIAGARERLTAAEKRIDECAASMACAGVDRHARGLVDDENVVVFVENVQRDGFRFSAELRARLRVHCNALAGTETMRALCGS